ncbi:hypothetical protein VNO77_27623 [Canavalia gladiata]|uniref:Uncharacterized protein n=1 Tax=Canavalia gladiata TaxID=3824 RepID=A0AAN9KW49_CANGL
MHGDSLGDHARVDKALMGVGVNEPIHECKGLVSEKGFALWLRISPGDYALCTTNILEGSDFHTVTGSEGTKHEKLLDSYEIRQLLHMPVREGTNMRRFVSRTDLASSHTDFVISEVDNYTKKSVGFDQPFECGLHGCNSKLTCRAKVPMNINPMDFYFVEEPKLGGMLEAMQVKRVEIMSDRHAGPSVDFVCLTNSWKWLRAPIAAFCLIPQYPW